MSNTTLSAVPLFVLMGIMLQRSRIAEELLHAMSALFGQRPGGLGISVVIVGALLAASTGIVGATVVTMGLMSLPTMLRQGYQPALACGTICATGTLGQIVPPSIALVLLGDILGNSYQQVQLEQGNFTPDTVSVSDLFMGAITPGLILIALYLLLLTTLARRRPQWLPALPRSDQSRGTALQVLRAILPPILLIVAVLGSILSGIATPTEAAGVGAIGATLLAAARTPLTGSRLLAIGMETMQVTTMVFMILIGATVFSLVFRGFGGDELITHLFSQLPGGLISAIFLVMLMLFLLGFILDFIEITFVVVPVVAPILFRMGVDPVWLGIMIAVNLQTSFLTPPFGFALFYLRGVAGAEVTTGDIYRGVMPFILLQMLLLVILVFWPELTTWLPDRINR
jgi:tripartite ATP-independent transporter DctM subunit